MTKSLFQGHDGPMYPGEANHKKIVTNGDSDQPVDKLHI